MAKDINSIIPSIKDLLGITDIERRLDSIEEKINNLETPQPKTYKTYQPYRPRTTRLKDYDVLNALDKPMTTTELSEKLGMTRSWVSDFLNKLWKNGKVEKERVDREIMYSRVE